MGAVKAASYLDVVTFNRLKLTSITLNLLRDDLKISVLTEFNWHRHFASQPEILSGLPHRDKLIYASLKKGKHFDTLFHYLARNGHFAALKEFYASFPEAPLSEDQISYKMIILYLSNGEYQTMKDLLPKSERADYKRILQDLDHYELSIEDRIFLRAYYQTLKINKKYSVMQYIELSQIFADLKKKAKENGLIKKPNMFVRFGGDEDNAYCYNNFVILPFGKFEFLIKHADVGSKSELASLFQHNPIKLIQACLQATIGHELGHMYYEEQHIKSTLYTMLQEKIYGSHRMTKPPYDMLLASAFAMMPFVSSVDPAGDQPGISTQHIVFASSVFVVSILARLYFQWTYSKDSRHEEIAADAFSANLSDDCLKGQYAYFKILSEKQKEDGETALKDPFSTHPCHTQRAEIAREQLIKKGYQIC